MYNPTSLAEVIEYLKDNMKIKMESIEDRYGTVQVDCKLYIGDVLIDSDYVLIEKD